MKEIYKIILIIVIIIIALLILSSIIFTIIKSPKCLLGGGIWWNFPDGCGDSCTKARGESIGCTLAFRESCNCGPFRCWNGKTCELNNKIFGSEK